MSEELKEKWKEYWQHNYAKNGEKIRAAARARYHANKEINRDKHRTYAEANRKKMCEYQRLHAARRRARDPGFRILGHLRSRLWRMIHRGHRPAKTLMLIGCSREDFMLHIQAQFRDGMSWNNHGSVWEFDHINPVSSFDLTDPEQQRECFHWTNTRPLLKEENRLWRAS